MPASPNLETKFVNPMRRVADRVLAGNVVFFVGAGFSIEAEGNSATRLIGRLLVRLVSLAAVLQRCGGDESQGGAILDRLRTAFRLQGVSRTQPARCVTRENVDALAREYYTFNEWVITALGTMADDVVAPDAVHLRETVDGDMRDMERLLIQLLGDEPRALEPVDWDAIAQLPGGLVRGKALFLDTMGFANEHVMAGRPREPDALTVLASYGDRLGARHHALARLAREGLAPLLVTTNYDLLLEGAYRLAGLVDRDFPPSSPTTIPAATIATYARVAGARYYFGSGETQRTARIFKIHGCVDYYRMARGGTAPVAAAGSTSLAGANPAAWAAYLPALVFSYREIQTWRHDAWSRDLIRTLLRTQSLVLCGYSGADPVLHSTFREVYDEMLAALDTRTPATQNEGATRAATAADAPLFFFDVAGKREFHGFELLRAASAASGLHVKDSLLEHPNHVEFEVASDAFPRLDDHFRLLLHFVMRETQQRALLARGRRLSLRLLKRPCPDAEHAMLLARFTALRESEMAAVMRSESTSTDAAVARLSMRRSFDAAVGWTWQFLPGLMRELALAELVESRQGPGDAPDGVRDAPWYYPVSERPEWAAWAAILEMAIQEMVQWVRGSSVRARPPTGVLAEESPFAVVSFPDSDGTQPVALCIRLRGFDRIGRPVRMIGAFRRIVVWEFTEQDVPWPAREWAERLDGPVPGTLTPPADIIWRFALGDAGWGASPDAVHTAWCWAATCLGVST